MTEQDKYNQAYEAIKAECEANRKEVDVLASAIMADIQFPLSMTLAAALYILAVSGAQALLEMEKANA